MKYFVNLMMTGALICAACLTSCKDDENEDTAVQSVTPTQSTVYILEGSTATVAATVFPNGADQRIAWTSENPNIASIVDRGQIDGIPASAVTGISLGSTTITAASVSDPGKKATVHVTVMTYIDSVTTDIDRITFILGAEETAAVEAAVMPANAIQTVTWTSSNPGVATVANGVIRAAGIGSATVTVASAIDPDKKATVEVEVVSLVNKVIHIASKFGNGLTVSWVNLGGDMVEFFYMDEAGQPASTIVPVTTQSSYIPDFGSTPLSYRTLYFSKGTGDTLRAPLVDFTGAVYNLCHYVKSSVAENIIQACDFDIGGEGIGFHDSNSTNAQVGYRQDRGDSRSNAISVESNLCIGSIAVNDWWQYTVYVENAGNYEIDFHVSVNGTGAQFRVEVDGETSDTYLMINNSNWSDWRYYFEFYRLDPPKFNLTAGRHVIRIYVVGTGFNYHGMRLTHKP
jgi:uncharacterized protein YjdB